MAIQPKMCGKLTARLLSALLLLGGVAWSHAVAAQTATPAPKAAPKPAAPAARARSPVRRPARPRVQTAPTRERIIEIQDALAREGFYSAKPSGRWDAVTSEAMRKFQTSNGLTGTGKVGAQSLQKLGLGSEVAGRGAPLPLGNPRASILTEADLNAPEPPQEP